MMTQTYTSLVEFPNNALKNSNFFLWAYDCLAFSYLTI